MKISLLLSFLILVIRVGVADAQTGVWQQVPGFPEGKRFTSLASPAPGHFVAVGDFGRIVRSTDGGLTWNDVPSGLPAESESGLTDLSFGSSLAGAAVGFLGNIVQTTDGGAEWFRGDVGVEGYLSSVFFLDENFGVVSNPFFLKTRDGGKSWEQRIFSVEGSMQDVVMLDTLRGVGVGPAGFAGSGTIFITEDGGETWDYIAVPEAGFRQFHAIAFADTLHGLIVGSDGGILRTEDGGKNWSLIATGVPAELTGVAMHDPMNALAVGWEGTILRTTDGGLTWEQETSPTSEGLSDVAFDEDGQAIIAGGDNTGVLLRYQEGPSAVGNGAERNAEEGFLAVAPVPARDRVRIEYSVTGKGPAELCVVDITGRRVIGPVRTDRAPGRHLQDFSLAGLPAGSYRVVLLTPTQALTMPLIIAE